MALLYMFTSIYVPINVGGNDTKSKLEQLYMVGSNDITSKLEKLYVVYTYRMSK